MPYFLMFNMRDNMHVMVLSAVVPFANYHFASSGNFIYCKLKWFIFLHALSQICLLSFLCILMISNRQRHIRQYEDYFTIYFGIIFNDKTV